MTRFTRTPKATLWCAIALLAGLGTWQSLRAQTAPAAPAQPANAAPATPVAPTPAAAAAAQPPSNTVRIVFITVPPANATVTWGKTRLGRTNAGKPLVVVRPRDSGPLDVIIRAPGFLTVHTRAHTFADTRLTVKLTPIDQKSTLLGYKAPIDAGTPFDPDAGVPTLSDMPPSLLFTPEPNTTPQQPPPAAPAAPQPGF